MGKGNGEGGGGTDSSSNLSSAKPSRAAKKRVTFGQVHRYTFTVDSAAETSVVGDAKLLLHPERSQVRLVGYDGRRSPANLLSGQLRMRVGRGAASAVLQVQGTQVRGAEHGLLSVAQLVDMGVRVRFAGDKSYMKIPKSLAQPDGIRIPLRRKGNTYVMDVELLTGIPGSRRRG